MYAQVSDVQQLAPHVTIDNSSRPPLGTVEAWIADVESTLNATLASYGYVMPLTAKPGKTTDAAVTVLRHMVSSAVMARIMRSRPEPPIDPETFQRQYDSLLKQLRDPKDPFELPDVETTQEVARKEPATRISSNLKDLLLEDSRVNRLQRF